jgi:hypothetical protein
MIAVAIPFLILSTGDSQSLGVLGATVACALLGFADRLALIHNGKIASAEEESSSPPRHHVNAYVQPSDR